NKHKNTIFIIDEASMISDQPGRGEGSSDNSLLDDLIEYVYSGRNCKLILIGDMAQLPPVHMELSPALDANQLELQYQMEVDQIELTEVVRQEEESGILLNATALRESIKDEFAEAFRFDESRGSDMLRLVDGEDIMNTINEAYGKLVNK